ncbi:MAG: DUF3696 domain-containing protein [Ignavibacteria bacterium]|nr:DUF3696 domain-containing protein [Ignavibacteria bacterium]
MALHNVFEFRWKNFKGFKDTDWIKIKPLTLLLGPNNSGKTSFISPILLMSQTISSRDPITPIITRGKITDQGSYRDLVHAYDTSKSLFFGFRYHIHEPEKKLKKIGTYPPGTIEIVFNQGKDSSEIYLKSHKVYDMYFRLFYSLTRTNAGNWSIRGVNTKKMRKKERIAINKSQPINFLFSPTPTLHNIDKQLGEDTNYKSERFSEEFSHFIQASAYNYSELRNIFNRLSYIGPLREIPYRYYQTASENYLTVGPKGENTANLLKIHIDKYQDEINEWIKKFDFGDELLIKDLSDELFTISFLNNKTHTKTNIANVGFGASQVLPLIVQALISPKESMTIAEQPEIHLNPKLQCILADLFSHMVSKDQRIIVETHSEHLLLSIRRLVAEKKIKSNDVAIYFVEKINDLSHIREIPLQENGHIEPIDWPKGFFQETLKESLALATEQAKI